jgi:hypothetical protein
MPTPSAAELITQLQNTVDLAEETRKFAEANSPNWVGIQDTLTQSLEGDYATEILAGMSAMRSNLAAMIDAGVAVITPHLGDWQRFLSEPSTNVQDILTAMYNDFLDNSRRIQPRAFTFGTPSASGSNTGNGSVRRLTVDANSQSMEAGTPEVKRLECVEDANSGRQRNREIFAVLGEDASPDGVESLGSGIDTTVEVANPQNAKVLNASFTDFGSTASAPTSITSWVSDVAVVGDGSDYSFTSGTTYLPAVDSEATIYGLVIKADRTLSQRLDDSGQSLDTDQPYYCQLAVNTVSASGTVTLRMGQVSASLSVTAGMSGWQVLRSPSSEGSSSWFAQFNETDLDIEIDWNSPSDTGSIVVDDLIFERFDFVNGTGLKVVPGTTAFLSRSSSLRDGDTFSITDTCTEAVIQRWMARYYGRYLPSSSSPTIADP